MKRILLALLESTRYYWCVCALDWWKRPPFLPIPKWKYLKWRLDTAYGCKENGWERPPLKKLLADSITFLNWRRRMRLQQEAKHG